MMSKSGVLLLSFALAACGEDAASTEPEPAEPSTAAVYVVPAGPDTPETEYPIASLDTEVDEEMLRVDYRMPELLVGVTQRVSLRGSRDGTTGPVSVSGDAGTAECEIMPSPSVSLRCAETLTGIDVDLSEVERVARTTDPGRVDHYLSIAARFSSEPIGVLEVRTEAR